MVQGKRKSKPLVFNLWGDDKLSTTIVEAIDGHLGQLSTRTFPDGERYLRVLSDVENQEIVLVTSLDNPDAKLISILFAVKTLKNLGARRVGLVTPYLPYMRQDKPFTPGEAVTSKHFSAILTADFDWVVTVDPHLHRIDELSDLYGPNAVHVKAAPAIVNWISENVKKPVIIGPDSESRQWAQEIADALSAPFLIARKDRFSDISVEIELPDPIRYQDYTPIVIDDIISTARTMIETVNTLKSFNVCAPVCIGVHALCTDDAMIALKQAGAVNIVTCNTIVHPSNGIDVGGLIADAVKQVVCTEQ